MKKYLNYFVVFVIVGFIAETVYSLILDINYNSGFLYGPWTPVYGFGIILVLILNKFINFKGIKKYFLFFLLSSFLITVIEILGGLFIETIFGVKFWGYGHHMFSIGQYASGEMMIVWGLVAVIFNYCIIPKIDKFIIKIPLFISISIIVLMICDLIFTLINGIR